MSRLLIIFIASLVYGQVNWEIEILDSVAYPNGLGGFNSIAIISIVYSIVYMNNIFLPKQLAE